MTQAEYAVKAGVDTIQVRERDLEARDLAAIVTELLRMTRGTRTRILVNDRLDVALACEADGVHLRADSVAPGVVRPLAPLGFIIGRSVHSVEEARAASNADYLIVGTVWATASKPEGRPLIGIGGFAAIARAVRIPTLAVGGVTADRAGEVAGAGGAGIAAIGLFQGRPSADGCGAVPLANMTDDLRQRFDTLRSGS